MEMLHAQMNELKRMVQTMSRTIMKLRGEKDNGEMDYSKSKIGNSSENEGKTMASARNEDSEMDETHVKEAKQEFLNDKEMAAINAGTSKILLKFLKYT